MGAATQYGTIEQARERLWDALRSCPTVRGVEVQGDRLVVTATGALSELWSWNAVEAAGYSGYPVRVVYPGRLGAVRSP